MTSDDTNKLCDPPFFFSPTIAELRFGWTNQKVEYAARLWSSNWIQLQYVRIIRDSDFFLIFKMVHYFRQSWIYRIYVFWLTKFNYFKSVSISKINELRTALFVLVVAGNDKTVWCEVKWIDDVRFFGMIIVIIRKRHKKPFEWQLLKLDD